MYQNTLCLNTLLIKVNLIIHENQSLMFFLQSGNPGFHASLHLPVGQVE